MAIKAINTTGAPNELYKAVSVAAGGGTQTHDFIMASTEDGGIVGIGTLSGTGNRAVYSDASGNLTNTSSDATLKTNVEDLQYGLEQVLLLRPVSYNWIDTDKRGAQDEVGLIAQEVQEVIPEVVGTNSDETLSLDYPKLVAVLINAIKELKAELDALKASLI